MHEAVVGCGGTERVQWRTGGLDQGARSAGGRKRVELRHTAEVQSTELDDELDIGSGRGDSQVLRLMNWRWRCRVQAQGRLGVGRFEEEEVLVWICWVSAASCTTGDIRHVVVGSCTMQQIFLVSSQMCGLPWGLRW